MRANPLLTDGLTNAPGALLNVMAPTTNARCVASVPLRQSHQVFAYTGYRMVVDVRLFEQLDRALAGSGGNLAGLRWIDIYDHIPSDEERLFANRVLTLGSSTEAEFDRQVDRFGVDMIVVRRRVAHSPLYEPYQIVKAECAHGTRYALVRITSCGLH